jgi:hypothetical protein
VQPPTPAPRPRDISEAPTVASKPPLSVQSFRERLRHDPARMVQALPEVQLAEAHAIPEVTGTVVDERIHAESASTHPRDYLPGDPMGPARISDPPRGGSASQPPRGPRSSQPGGEPGRPRRPREMQFAADYDEREQSTYILLYWAVCIAVVVAVAALAFRIF